MAQSTTPLSLPTATPRARELFSKTLDLLALNSSHYLKLALAQFVLFSVVLLLMGQLPNHDVASPTFVLLTIFCVAGVIADGVLVVAIYRQFVALSRGLALDLPTLLRDTVKRVPYIIFWYLLLLISFTAVSAVPVLLAIWISGWFALLILPMMAGMFFLISYLSIGLSLLIVGPRGALIETTMKQTTGRWWLVFRMGIIVNIMSYGVSAATVLVVPIGSQLGAVGSAVSTAAVSGAQTVVLAAGFAAMHHHLGLPTGEELLPPGFDPEDVGVVAQPRAFAYQGYASPPPPTGPNPVRGGWSSQPPPPSRPNPPPPHSGPDLPWPR